MTIPIYSGCRSKALYLNFFGARTRMLLLIGCAHGDHCHSWHGLPLVGLVDEFDVDGGVMFSFL